MSISGSPTSLSSFSHRQALFSDSVSAALLTRSGNAKSIGTVAVRLRSFA